MEKFNKNNPFKTPENYFDNVSNSLSSRLSEEKKQLPKEDGFILPKGYLDTLNETIQDKLTPKENKVIQLKPNMYYYMAAASIAAIFILVFGLYWNTPKEPTWDNVVNTDIESYFDDNGFGLTSYEIAEVIPVEGLEINNFLETQLNEENILDYLNDHTSDFEELNLEDYE